MTKIFISSRIEELKEERNLVKKVIEELTKKYSIDIAPRMFESELAPPSTTTREASLIWVKESDALICLYYKTISLIVKKEFRTANNLFMPIFVFKKKVNESQLKGDGRRKYNELIKFIEEEIKSPVASPSEEGYIYKEFENKDDLVKKIEKAILWYYPRRFEFQKISEKYLTTSDKRTDRIKKVYVKPKRYEDAENKLKEKRLLVITGSAHLGKTSMGYYLGISNKNKIVRRFLRFPEDGSLDDIEKLRCSIILFDDPFGGARFEYSSVANNIKRIRDIIRNNNYIVITSRKEVLLRALQETKLGEENLKENIFELTTDDYNDAIFKDILYKHLDYYKTPKEGRKIVHDEEDFIIRNLRFPHNYQVFVENELKEVLKKKKSIWRAVGAAEEIERACGNWFSRFHFENKELFSFVFAVALFNNIFKEKYFFEMCKTIMRLNGLNITNISSHDIDRLKSQTSSYILQDQGITKFAHPSYEEGVWSEIENNYLGLVERAVLEIPWLRSMFEDVVKISGIFRKTITIKFAGKVVEKGSVSDVLKSPGHPFTKYLLENLPKEIKEEDKIIRVLKNKDFVKKLIFMEKLRNIHKLIRWHRGCPFHMECPYAMDICTKEDPPLKKRGGNHFSRCYLEELP